MLYYTDVPAGCFPGAIVPQDRRYLSHAGSQVSQGRRITSRTRQNRCSGRQPAALLRVQRNIGRHHGHNKACRALDALPLHSSSDGMCDGVTSDLLPQDIQTSLSDVRTDVDRLCGTLISSKVPQNTTVIVSYSLVRRHHSAACSAALQQCSSACY